MAHLRITVTCFDSCIIIFNNTHKVLFCLTDTSLYIYTCICVKHFGMANIKFMASQAKTINLYKNTISKLL